MPSLLNIIADTNQDTCILIFSIEQDDKKLEIDTQAENKHRIPVTVMTPWQQLP